jgi:hypothetical protein
MKQLWQRTAFALGLRLPMMRIPFSRGNAVTTIAVSGLFESGYQQDAWPGCVKWRSLPGRGFARGHRRESTLWVLLRVWVMLNSWIASGFGKGRLVLM